MQQHFGGAAGMPFSSAPAPISPLCGWRTRTAIGSRLRCRSAAAGAERDGSGAVRGTHPQYPSEPSDENHIWGIGKRGIGGAARKAEPAGVDNRSRRRCLGDGRSAGLFVRRRVIWRGSIGVHGSLHQTTLQRWTGHWQQPCKSPVVIM